MQHAFATNKTFIQHLIDSIQETIKEVKVDLKLDRIYITVGHLITGIIAGNILGIKSESSESIRQVQLVSEAINDHMKSVLYSQSL